MGKSLAHQPPMLIIFYGIDGAGKTTQIDNLCQSFRTRGFDVRIITFWDEVAQLKSIREEVSHKVFQGDRGVGTPDAPIMRRDKNVRSPVMTLFRLGLYALDAFALRMKVATAQRSSVDVIIFDRFLYDELANLDLRRQILRIYTRFLLRVIPKPDIAFILDADPAEAFTRKPEYPLEFLRSNRDSYLRLARLADGLIVIPALPIEAAVEAVFRLVSGVSRGTPVS